MLGPKCTRMRACHRSRNAFGSCTVVRPASLRTARRSSMQRTSTVTVRAIFGLFGQASATPAPKAAAIVDELLELVSKNKPQEEQVAELAKQLQAFSIKNPVRSKQLFGEYKLVYSSKPVAGSPRQILDEPDQLTEMTTTTALGFLPATAVQSGELNGLDGTTYEEVFTRLETKSPLGTESRDIDIVKMVTVLYLDSELRIVRTLTPDQTGEGTLAVYKRVVPAEEEAEEAEEERKPGTGMSFFGGGPKEGIATISERQVRKKMAAEEARGKAGPRVPVNLPASPAAALAAFTGTTKIGLKPPATSQKSGTAIVARPSAEEKKRKEAEAARAKEAEARVKAKEAEAKAREAAAAKEKAEADKRAQAERTAAIKSQLEQLSQEFKSAQDASRQAVRTLKDLERSNAPTLKQVSNARLQLRDAASGVSDVEGVVSKAAEARAAAENALKQALADVASAQNKVKNAGK